MLAQQLSLFIQRHCLAVALFFGICFSVSPPAFALLDMNTKSINAALVYGMKNQKIGLSNLLGANWVENADGALLNVYSPFMMLATKASKAHLALLPAPSDLAKARKRFARDIAFYSDSRNRIMVKFSVSFYGDSPSFAKQYSARIVGVGRGRHFDLKPEKQLLDQIADEMGVELPASPAKAKAEKEINMNQPSTGITGLPESKETKASDEAFSQRLAEEAERKEHPEKSVASEESAVQPASARHHLNSQRPVLYQGINAYYFPLSTLLDLDEFQLILESPKGPPVTFRLNNARLY
jgi:hypothetical protein